MIELLIRFFIGGLLVCTGLLKLPNLKGLIVVMASYRILPGYLNKLAAYTMPFAEVLLGFWLILDWFPPLAPIFVSLHFLALTTATVVVMLRGNRMDNCGCYGADIKIPLTWAKVFENMVWITLTLSLLGYYPGWLWGMAGVAVVGWAGMKVSRTANR